MAAGLHAQWLAVFVESQQRALSEASRAGAIENLRLAERLGAETLTLSSRDVVEGTLDLARQRNITKIIVGKTGAPAGSNSSRAASSTISYAAARILTST